MKSKKRKIENVTEEHSLKNDMKLPNVYGHEEWKGAVLLLNELLLWTDQEKLDHVKLEIPKENDDDIHLNNKNDHSDDISMRELMRKNHFEFEILNFFQHHQVLNIIQHEKSSSRMNKLISEIVFNVLIPILSSPIVMDANIHSFTSSSSEHVLHSQSCWLVRERMVIFLSQKCLFNLWKLESSETTKQFIIHAVMKNISENLLKTHLDIFKEFNPNTEPLLFLRNCLKYVRKERDQLSEELTSNLYEIFSKFIELTCSTLADQQLAFTLLFIMDDLIYNYLKFWKCLNQPADDSNGEKFREISAIINFVKLQLVKRESMDVNCKKLFSIMRSIINISNCAAIVPTLLETCSFILEHFLSKILLMNPNASQTLVSETMDSIVAREYFLLALRAFEICISLHEKGLEIVESFMTRNQNILSQILEHTSMTDFYAYINAIGVSHDVHLLMIFNSLLNIFRAWKESAPTGCGEHFTKKEMLDSFIQEQLHPLEVMFQFIEILSKNTNVMMDYLISDETCEYTLQLLFKFAKWVKYNMTNELKKEELDSYDVSHVKEKLQVISEFLQELHNQIFSLHQKNLFPYSPKLLQERLKDTIESLSSKELSR
ncbi:hypothetical protein C9374_012271 [Naegleria lovaniensis]|uniref:Uncharacterized protein n=1 Tax=Naegleria lovaniensis TaxID=51637 RepID=A0AA88KHW8_NAELO|nr:uncharacterized protein C9374_012271 [Naegleria lovaniensis]KAG2373282.1 hypothetical protein C9374_012271 [Naegleria lovaniensis]